MKRTQLLLLSLVMLCLAVLCIPVQCNAAKIAVFSAQPTFATAVSSRIAALGFETVPWTDASMVTTENLNGVNALMVLSGFAFLLESQNGVIESYVANGGALIVEQPNIVGPVPIMPPGLEVSVADRTYPNIGAALTAEGLAHPMTTGLFDADLSGNMDTVYAQDISSAYTILAAGALNPDLVALAAATYGNGKVVFHTGNVHPYSILPGSDEYLRRMVTWATTPDAPVELAVDLNIGPKKINLKSGGSVRITVLSNQNFDAAAIDPASVTIAGVSPEKWIAQDMNADGYIDLTFAVSTKSLPLNAAVTQLELTGRTNQGQPIHGAGAVSVTTGKK